MLGAECHLLCRLLGADCHLLCRLLGADCHLLYRLLGADCHLLCWLLGAECHRFQFECVNTDAPALSECIAVYDRCNGIIQCRDGSDERDCPTDDDGDTAEVELVSSLTPRDSWPSDAEVKNSHQQNVVPDETDRSKMLDRVSNVSQSKGVAVDYGGRSHTVFDDGNRMADGDHMRHRDEHLQQMSDSVDDADSVAGGRPESPSPGGNTPTRTYKHKAISGSDAGKHEDSVAEPVKPVGRMTEEERGPQMLADGKFAGDGKQNEGGGRPSTDDAVSERGHLLLSAMVDKSDESKHADRTQMRYPAVESGQKLEPVAGHTDNQNTIKDSGGYRKVVEHKPMFGSVDVDKSVASPASQSIDRNHQQPIADSHYGTADEVRRLRKPDLSRVDAGPSDSHWPSPEKSPSYGYDLSSPGKYTDRDYAKSNTRPHTLESELPSSGKFSSSSLASHDSRLAKNYGRGSDSSSDGSRGGGGPVRGGLTEARQRNPVDQKNRDRGSDTGGFLSNRPLGSQYERHEASESRSHGFSDGKPSYNHAVEAPTSYEGSRHGGLVADQLRFPSSNSQFPSNGQYPSNGRDVLYGDSYYPASDDYYYGHGLAGPPGHGAGYDSQAPADYDYYNMAPGQL